MRDKRLEGPLMVEAKIEAWREWLKERLDQRNEAIAAARESYSVDSTNAEWFISQLEQGMYAPAPPYRAAWEREREP